METQLNELYDAILVGQLEPAVAVTERALAAGIDPQTVINGYMIPAMEEIGRRFEAGEAYVPNLLMSARAMKGALELLRPLLRNNTAESRGRIVIGTVRGDLHDIGKNLVASMFEGCGFEVFNIGVDISSDRFIEAAREHRADILCMSALLTTTMTYYERGDRRPACVGSGRTGQGACRRGSRHRGLRPDDRRRRIQFECQQRRADGPAAHGTLIMRH